MLEQQINNDYKQAMKDRDAFKVSTLSFLRAQIKNLMIDQKVKEVEDTDVILVIKKQVKQRQDSIEQYEKGGREDLAEKERQELALLKTYLPEEMSQEQIRPLVAEAIQEVGATSIKDMGNVMKVIVSKVAGKADNKIVSTLVREALSQI